MHTRIAGGCVSHIIHVGLGKPINPHHPCGWWPHQPWQGRVYSKISIHTTRVGGDCNRCIWLQYRTEFQSTPPVWVVTHQSQHQVKVYILISIHTTRVGGDAINYGSYPMFFKISIHTTRVGGDLIRALLSVTPPDFNPHHPCGWWLRYFLLQNI